MHLLLLILVLMILFGALPVWPYSRLGLPVGRGRRGATGSYRAAIVLARPKWDAEFYCG
jgi:hypothetical protein